MGKMKPTVDRPKYRKLTDEEITQVKSIVSYLKDTCGELYNAKETAFDFLKEFYAKPESDGKDIVLTDSDGIRYAYSYFAVYGDPLLDPELDPYPDGLLKKYAECGVNGIWLQGVLYQLVPYPFDESMSKGWETRIKNLRSLCNRAKNLALTYFYTSTSRELKTISFLKNIHI